MFSQVSVCQSVLEGGPIIIHDALDMGTPSTPLP